MIIDSETGLPQLPENYWWEVIGNQHSFWRSTDYTVYLKKTERVPSKPKNTYPWYYFGFKKVVDVPSYDTEKVILTHTVNLLDTGESTDKENGRTLSASFINSDVLLKVTTDMFEHWEKWERKEAESKATLGKYPPKTINKMIEK